MSVIGQGDVAHIGSQGIMRRKMREIPQYAMISRSASGIWKATIMIDGIFSGQRALLEKAWSPDME
ncbi:hypothetical protein A0U92_03085 [Acetobacter aceti]|uniref:Uncharacterized protein n=1 Tax=Acetobacter aceti TaxID=435 RepID=A0A1U9KDP5_ACEAC|nr:hypothetical protein A0U92_03085 [Acetobacter aceti]